MPNIKKGKKLAIERASRDSNNLCDSEVNSSPERTHSSLENSHTKATLPALSVERKAINKKPRKEKAAEPPLYFSARKGNFQKLKYCLKLGNNPNMNYSELLYQSPLIAAVQFRHTKCVELLLKHGADANTKDKSGHYALALALAWSQEQPEVCRLLVAHGARPDVEYWPNKTIAQLAFSQKNIDQVGVQGKEAYAIIRDTCYANKLIPLTDTDIESADHGNLQN